MKVGDMQGHIDIDRETIRRFNNLSEEITKLGETLTTTFAPTIEAVNQSISCLVEDWEERVITPAVIDFQKNLTILIPHRIFDESLTQWAYRLEQAGIWDDPDIRWMYQKECLRVVFFAPYRWVKGLVERDE